MSSLYNISIIIPHYTRSTTALLVRAVNSIPIDKSLQVLIIDNSPVKIDKNLFANRGNVEILYSDNTKGAGHARNVGLDKSEGKWLLFLDADDFFVDKTFDLLKEFYDSTDDIIFFRMTSCFSDTLEKAERHKVYDNIIDNYFETNNEHELRCFYPSPCGKLVKTKFVKENSIYFDEVLASNDEMFALKIGLAAKNIHVDSRIIYCATVQKASLTNVISLQNIESRFDVSLRKNKMMKAHGFKKESSVMYFIISSMKYGITPFFNLFYRALKAGDLFVGYNRWLKTLLKRPHLINKKYKIKE